MSNGKEQTETAISLYYHYIQPEHTPKEYSFGQVCYELSKKLLEELPQSGICDLESKDIRLDLIVCSRRHWRAFIDKIRWLETDLQELHNLIAKSKDLEQLKLSIKEKETTKIRNTLTEVTNQSLS